MSTQIQGTKFLYEIDKKIFLMALLPPEQKVLFLRAEKFL